MSRYLLTFAITLPAALLLVSQPLAQPTVSVSTVPSPDCAYPGRETTVRVELLNPGEGQSLECWKCTW